MDVSHVPDRLRHHAVPDGFVRRMGRGIMLLIASPRFRLGFLIAGFIMLVFLRRLVGSFGVSLGYLYVFLISLAGLWFGITGGIIAAATSSVIFLVEVSLLTDWPGRDVVLRGLPLRFFVYFLEGIMLGLLCRLEKKLVDERKQKDHLQTLAYRDELTGCLNYRWIVKKADNEILRASRYQKLMSLAVLDIDHFKVINDTYGHLSGNQVLKVVAESLSLHLRTVDALGRYGGDEFLLILPETDADEAKAVLERMKHLFVQTGITLSTRGDAEIIRLAFSAGIATYPTNGHNGDELIFSADSALYRAKRSGRNRVMIERRQAVRYAPLPNLRIEIGDCSGRDWTEALEIENVSRSGMLILHPRLIPHADVCARISGVGDDTLPEIGGRVVRQWEVGGRLFRVGIAFVDVPDRVMERLCLPEAVLASRRFCSHMRDEEFAALPNL